MKQRRRLTAISLAAALSLTSVVGIQVFAEEEDASEIAGTYTCEAMTLVLNDDDTFTLSDGDTLDISGTFTCEAESDPGNSSAAVILDDEGKAVLAESLPWYWDGTITLDQDAGEFTGTFTLPLDISLAMIGMGGENGYTAETVEDPDSPTGYMTTITLPDNGYDSVYAYGSWIAYSIDLTDPDDPTSYSTEGTEPEDWQNGMYYNSGSAREMTKEETDDGTVWTLSLPLASSIMGCLCYHDVDMDDISGVRVTDENKFYVPYDEEKQSESFNWTVAFQNEEAAGEVDDSVVCTTEEGYDIQLSVYTPYDYDESGQYPVLYLIPGGGTTYVTWFEGGHANYIFDNLTAEGIVDPTIIVSMDRQDAVDYLTSDIIPYIEENYSASPDAAHLALVGTSMGGVATTQFWMTDTDLFDYYGFFSGADPMFKNDPGDFTDIQSGIEDMSEEYWNDILDELKNTAIVAGGGTTDFNMFDGDENSASITEVDAWLTYYEIDHDTYVYGGGHSWTTWTQLLLDLAEDYLWQ